MAADRFRPRVLDQLLALGIRPRHGTDPVRVRAHLNDLYTFELRQLRRELVQAEARAGRKLRAEYGKRVQVLRRKYALLSQPVETWIEAGAQPLVAAAEAAPP
jgi:hypothetical protein